MTHIHTSTGMQEAVQRHLAANALQLARLNILVHVDTVSASRQAAFCSVEQLHHGWLWHTCSVEELTWRAEQALAPLMGMGILPMITVKHRSLHNGTAATPQRLALLQHWFGRLTAWSGMSLGRHHRHAAGEAADPFGWRAASARGPQQGRPAQGGGPAPGHSSSSRIRPTRVS